MEFRSDGDTLFAHVVEREAARGGEEDRTVVLLHPTPLDHRFWSAVLPALAAYRVVTPDLRGHGRSSLGSAPWSAGLGEPVLTVGQLARDAVALLNALGVERALFAGCSIGGYTLYELWRTAPERMAAAVFCASKPQADNEVELARRAEWIERHDAARRRGDRGPLGEFVEAMLTTLLSVETRSTLPAIVAEARAMMEQVAPGSIQAVQRGLACRRDSRATAASLGIATCVIAGAEDPSSRPEDMAALYKLLRQGGSQSEYHVVADAAHYVAMEQPRATAEILAGFCRRAWDSQV